MRHALVLVVVVVGCGGGESGPDAGYVCVPEGRPAPAEKVLFAPLDLGLEGDGVGVQRIQVADLDGDGADELIMTTYGPETPFFVLRGGEDIAAQTGLAGVRINAAAWGDVDGDGDVDLVNFVPPDGASTLDEDSRGVWRNDGAAGFTRVADTDAGIALDPFDNPHSLTLADFDQDGALDIYLATWYGSNGAGGLYLPTPDRLFRGNGDGTFVDVTDELGDQYDPDSTSGAPGRAGFGVAPGDFDDDGDIDLYVSAYGAGRPAAGAPPTHDEYNLLWRNGGDMRFRDVADEFDVAASIRGIGGVEDEIADPGPVVMDGVTYYQPIGGNSFGALWADLDNDADRDLLVTNIGHPDYPQSDRTLLYLRDGDGFDEVSAAAGLAYREYELFPGIFDVNNDGLQDIAIAGQWNGTFGGNNWELYLQQPDHTFRRLTPGEIGIDHRGQPGWNWADFDGDGDLDVFLAAFEGPLRAFRNLDDDDHDWLEVRLEGPDVGARVTIETSAGVQSREVTAGSSHYSQQTSRKLYFGLGTDGCAANVRVRWPDGTDEVVGDVPEGVLSVARAAARR